MRSLLLAFCLVCVAASAAATEPAGTAVHVVGDGLEQTIHCHGNAVSIDSSRSRFTIEGRCSIVSVQGSRNWIEVQDADRIKTSGTLNSVLYLNPGTRVSDAGRGNSIAPKWQQ